MPHLTSINFPRPQNNYMVQNMILVDIFWRFDIISSYEN